MLTDTQQRIIAAIEQGHTTTRAIASAAGLASNSNVSRQLQQLADGGHVVLRHTAHGITVARGADFCAAWDAAARLAGNPDA
jgi:SOS-response transcriptional repressor LexA